MFLVIFTISSILLILFKCVFSYKYLHIRMHTHRITYVSKNESVISAARKHFFHLCWFHASYLWYAPCETTASVFSDQSITLCLWLTGKLSISTIDFFGSIYKVLDKVNFSFPFFSSIFASYFYPRLINMSTDLHPITLPNGKKLEGKIRCSIRICFIIKRSIQVVYTDFIILT